MPSGPNSQTDSQPAWAFDWRRDRKLLGYTLIVGLAIWTYGIDSGETSGFLAMQAFLKDFGEFDPALGAYNMSAHEQTRMYGIELGFALIGCYAAGSIGARFGRKIGLALTAIVCILGPAIQMISHVPALLVGRAFLGLGAGSAAVLAIAYWSEVATPALRGRVVMFYQLFINLASFVGACINQGTYKKRTSLAYRIPLIVGVIVPVFLLILIWLVPESPRWLVTRGRLDEAKSNLREIRGTAYTQEELDQEMKETTAFTAIESELGASASFLDCFKGTDRRRTIIATVLCVGEQMMGIGFLGGYITYFFALIGFTDAFTVSVISSACAIGGSLVSIFAIQYCGRRLLLIVGAAVNAFCMFAFAITTTADPTSKAAAKSVAAFICIFTFTYSATWGTVVPVVVGEIPSNKLRSKSLGISVSFTWAGAILVICGAPYLIQPQYANLGTKVGFIFGGLTVPLLLFAIFFVPETKGRSLEEIDEMFLNHVPARRFKDYVCTGTVGDLSEDAVYQSMEQKGIVTHVEMQ